MGPHDFNGGAYLLVQGKIQLRQATDIRRADASLRGRKRLSMYIDTPERTCATLSPPPRTTHCG